MHIYKLFLQYFVIYIMFTYKLTSKVVSQTKSLKYKLVIFITLNKIENKYKLWHKMLTWNKIIP
jgi:hypothetical protein